MADNKMPLGITKLKNEDIASLLRNLIEICDDKVFEKYLISINKEMLEVQKKLLNSEKSLKTRTEKAKDLGLSEGSISKLEHEFIPVINSQLDKQNKIVVKALGAIKDSTVDSKKLEGKNQKVLDEVVKSTKVEMKERLKSKATDLGKKSLQRAGKSSEAAVDQTLTSLLGPLQMITGPMEDFFKFNINDSVKGGVKGLFNKSKDDLGPDKTEKFLSKRIRPKKSELLKGGIFGASSIYMTDEITNALQDLKEESGFLSKAKDGLTDDITGGLTQGGIAGLTTAGLLSKGILFKGLGIAGIAISVIWGIIDGIKAYGQAEEWGVSGVSAALGGFFGGSEAAGGMNNAFKNGSKLAIAGAGVGLVLGLGPMGVLAGGLIGAVLGGIAGFIGPEKLAIAFEKTGEWFDKKWTALIESFEEFFAPVIDGILLTIANIKAIFAPKENDSEEKSMLEKITLAIGEVLLGVLNVPLNYINSLWGGFDKLVTDTLDEEGDEVWETVKTEAGDWFGLIFDSVFGGFSGALDGWLERAENIKEILGDDETTTWTKIKLSLKEFVLGIIETPILYFKGALAGILENEKYQETADLIKGWFTELKKGILYWIWNLLPDFGVKGLALMDIEPPEGFESWKETRDSELIASGVGSKPKAGPGYGSGWGQRTDLGTIGEGSLEGIKSEDLGSKTDTGTVAGGIKVFEGGAGAWGTGNEDEDKMEEINEAGEGFFKKVGNFFKEGVAEAKDLYNAFNDFNAVGGSISDVIESINDGVIMSNGKVIKTHPDDNIIATKNDPLLLNRKDNQTIQKDIEKNYFSKDLSKTDEEALKKFDTMITALNVIASKIKGNTTTIVENKVDTNIDFNSLRIGVK